MMIFIIALYLLTRFYGLAQFPIFSDESIYINLAQKIADNPLHPLLFRMEGKQPLFFWLNALAFKVFADPLLAGRMVSIMAGLASLTGIYLIGRHLFSEKHALIAACIYVLCPYTLFFDRLALVDSLLSASGIWLVYIALLFVRGPSSKLFILMGLMMSLSFYIKSTSLLLMPIPILIIFIFECHLRAGFWKQLSMTGLAVILLIAPIYLFGDTVGYFERTELLQIPNKLSLTLEEILAFPWPIWRRNALIALEFFSCYLTWPLALLVLFGMCSRDKRNIILVIWAAFPTVMIIVLANGFFSRYFLISVPPLILLASAALSQLTEFIESRIKLFPSPALLGAFLLMVLSDSIVFTWELAGNPLKAPIHYLDRILYLEGMNSGFGISEAVQFLTHEAQAQPITLLIHEKPGNPPQGVAVYLWKNQRVRLQSTLLPEQRKQSDSTNNTYFIYPYTAWPEEKFLQANPDFTKVWSLAKPDGEYSINIFKRKTD